MLLVSKLDPRATVPTCGHAGEDLGYDVYALESTLLIPGVVTKVRTGIAVSHSHEVLSGGPSSLFYVSVEDGLLVKDRSSMAAQGVRTSGGVIDAGYRGEVIVLMTFDRYLTDIELQTRAWYGYAIAAGQKIAQLVPIPVLTRTGVSVVDGFSGDITTRGAAGFGSTGR